MAQEMVNRMFAGVKVAADGTIIARSAAVDSVVPGLAGIYTLTLNEAIASTELAWGQCPDVVSGTPGARSQTVRRLSNTQFEIRTYLADVLTNAGWNLAIHRLNSQNGA